MTTSKTSAAAILADVSELLSEPTRWTKGTAARLADNLPVAANHPHARCWCLTGAVDHCGYRARRGTPAMILATRALSSAILLNDGLEPDPGIRGGGVYDRVAIWNDMAEREHGEIVAVIAEARARLAAVAN